MLGGVLICLGWVVLGFELLSFEFLLLEVLGFEFGVDDGTDEGIETIVTLALAGFGVNGSVGRAAFELGIETLLPFCAFGFIVEFDIGLLAGLFETVVVCDFVGMGRTAESLKTAIKKIDEIKKEFLSPLRYERSEGARMWLAGNTLAKTPLLNSYRASRL